MSTPKLTGIERIMALRRGEDVGEVIPRQFDIPDAPFEETVVVAPVEITPEIDPEG